MNVLENIAEHLDAELFTLEDSHYAEKYKIRRSSGRKTQWTVSVSYIKSQGMVNFRRQHHGGFSIDMDRVEFESANLKALVKEMVV